MGQVYGRGLSVAPRLVSAGVFVLAVLAVLGFRAALPAAKAVNENSDFKSFHEPVARNLMGGRGLVRDDGSIALRYPPGYSLITAGTFMLGRALGISEAQAIGGLSAIAVGVAAICVFALSATVWPWPRALIAAGLLVTYPLLMWLTKQPNSEVPFLALFAPGMLSFWTACRSSKGYGLALLAGLLIGFSMLVRPIAMGTGVLFAAFAWAWARGSRRHGARIAGILLLGNALVVVPWEVWAFNRTGRVVPLSTGGVASVRDGLAFAGLRKDWRETKTVPADIAELTAEIEAHYGELKTLGDVVSLLERETVKRPLAVAKLLAWKAVRVWYATDSRRYETAIVLLQIPYLALLAWCGYRARGQGLEAGRLATLVLGCCALFWAMAFVALSIVRYVVPAIALSFAIVPAAFPVRSDLVRGPRLFGRDGRPGGGST